jgi:hypothetical protein
MKISKPQEHAIILKHSPMISFGDHRIEGIFLKKNYDDDDAAAAADDFDGMLNDVGDNDGDNISM